MVGTDATDRCPTCAKPVTSVVISVEDVVVRMRSCNRCDRRWWTAGDEEIEPTTLFARRSA